jgi:hypothetical protein
MTEDATCTESTADILRVQTVNKVVASADEAVSECLYGHYSSRLLNFTYQMKANLKLSGNVIRLSVRSRKYRLIMRPPSFRL